ncbi:hypothetical protein POM88_046080 [Heracleum sosnowskyi]|uniref:Uncharacterized protein n=1 Tax=Heracleum sosnowskyi TaxID=360622 RepID=A0AAD8M5K8_9APIA|nr:hypothetical protein POM88_046080 [Heracleum sosnowskyi]
MVFEFGATASLWDALTCVAALFVIAGLLSKHGLIRLSSKRVQHPLLPHFLVCVVSLTSSFSFVEARDKDARKVGRSGFWLILFLVLMALGAGTGSSRGGRGRGSRGGRGRGGRGNGSGRGSDSGEGRGRGGDIELGDDDEGNEGNEGEGGDEGQESQNVPRIRFERAERSCSKGDYMKRPATDADRDTVHFLEGRNIKEAKKKKTLSYIVKMNWDENTHKTKGAEREIFYDRCLNEFKKYYAYPKGYDENVGDRAVKEFLKRSWKSLPYQEKDRAERDEKLANKIEPKYTRLNFRPHYFSPGTWESLNKYWESDLFKGRSINGKKARAKLEHVHHSGAMPFDERREILEDEKQRPISDLEFMDYVYHFDNPADKQLREDMERVRVTQSTETPPPEGSTSEPPPSPGTLKKIHRKKEMCLTIQARPPKKGKAILHPRQPVAEVFGAYEAARLTASQSTPSQQISDNSLDLVLRVSSEVYRMVRSLEMTEVPRELLNEQMHRLADEAFPNQTDPVQQALWTEYMRLATVLVDDAMALYEKVILEGTGIEKAHITFRNNNDEDDDQDAERYSLNRR